ANAPVGASTGGGPSTTCTSSGARRNWVLATAVTTSSSTSTQVNARRPRRGGSSSVTAASQPGPGTFTGASSSCGSEWGASSMPPLCGLVGGVVCGLAACPGIMARMALPGNPSVNNRGDANYRDTIAEIARLARAWSGPIVIVAHVDPDGDALGSTLALRRALEALGKQVLLPMEPPRYLAFLAEEGELSPALDALPAGTLLFVLDVADRNRVWGAPVRGAERVVNIDHHGTNDRFGDLAVVEPGKAATALLIKELIEVLGVAWTPAIATPCLTGI